MRVQKSTHAQTRLRPMPSAWPISLAEVQRLEGLVIAESESKRDKFEKRKQLLPRERVARLLDRGTPFLEISRLAGLNMHDDDGKKAVLGGGSIVGIGVVSGKRCLISVNDSAVKGGTVAPMGLKKACAVSRLPRKTSCPSFPWWRAAAPI